MVFIVMMWGLYIQSDDKELFMGSNVDQSLVKPNVIILMDSSISMNYVLFYPRKGLDGIEGTEDDGYDPNVQYTGTVYNPVYSLSAPKLMARWRTPQGDAKLFKYDDDEVGTNWTGCYGSDGSGSYFQVGQNSQYFNVGERIMYIEWGYSTPNRIAVATIESKDTAADGSTWFKLKDIEGDTIVANSVSGSPPTVKGHFQRPMGADYLLVDLVLYGYRDDRGGSGYQDTLYLADYLTWVYCHATVKQLDAIRNFLKYGIFVYTEDLTPEIEDTPNTWSTCDKENYQS